MNLLRKIRRVMNAYAGVERQQVLFYSAFPPLDALPAPAGVRVECFSLAFPNTFGEFSATMAEERFAAGDLLYVAISAGVPVHHSWVKLQGVQEVSECSETFPVADGEFWIYHCWTSQSARGCGIYPYVLSLILAERFASGARCGWIYTTQENLSSQKGIARARFRSEFRRQVWRIGPWRVAV